MIDTVYWGQKGAYNLYETDKKLTNSSQKKNEYQKSRWAHYIQFADGESGLDTSDFIET